MGVACDIVVHIPKEKKHITGQPITGIVKFHLDNDKVYKKITLSLVERRLSWLDYGCKDIDDYATKRIWKRDNYQYEDDKIKKVIQMNLVNQQIDENITLKAGSHEHLFAMKIPENIPPSVNIAYNGKPIEGIEYYLLLQFIKPKILSWNTYFTTKITIYNGIDSSITEEPITATLNKTLVKLFSSEKHEVKLKAVLDKGYFTPYSERKISLDVINNSDVIFTVQTELICKTKLELDTNDPIKKTEVLASVETPSIPDNSVSKMFNIIPVGPDTCTVKHSNKVKRNYKIRITMNLPPPHVNSFIEIPVFVGERLLEKNNDQEAGESSIPIEEPPSYWEAVSCEANIPKNDMAGSSLVGIEINGVRLERPMCSGDLLLADDNDNRLSNKNSKY